MPSSQRGEGILFFFMSDPIVCLDFRKAFPYVLSANLFTPG
jgi:hypothetical protein